MKPIAEVVDELRQMAKFTNPRQHQLLAGLEHVQVRVKQILDELERAQQREGKLSVCLARISGALVDSGTVPVPADSDDMWQGVEEMAARIKELEQALHESKREHDSHCDDPVGACWCGANERNAAIDRVLAGGSK